MNEKLKDSLQNLQRANASLHMAINHTPRNALIISAIIKNFEFNFELSWKAMKRLLTHHGVPTSSPRQAIAESYRKRFLANEESWIGMIEDRNLTVHTYDENFAKEMATRIETKYISSFDAFLERLLAEVSSL
jgi:nucleotidyltransferase substrate binding protein (TIGR01987 family)